MASASTLRAMALLGALLLASACQSTPPRPLFQSLEAEAGFGYSDRQIDQRHWEVTYVGPRYRSTYGESDTGEADAARTQAYDLALWRAAQIALEQDRPRFAVVTERRDLDRSTEINRRYSSYPFYPYGFRRYGPWGWPWYGNDYSVRSFGEATVTLTIDLDPGPDARIFDAKETADRLEAEYAFKTWPPQ